MKRFKKKKDIRVGVIGYGGAFNMGCYHLNDMAAAGMTPVAACDVDPARVAVAEEDFPDIETYTSVTAMLKKSDVDLVTIITPHNTHARLAMQCLRAKRHVVTEKPMCITTAECDRLISEARKRRMMMSTFHNRHWDGRARDMVRMVRKKKMIGDVFRIEAHMGGYSKPGDWWRSSKSLSGGIMYDWGVHLLEYCLQLTDGNMTEVMGLATSGFWAPKTRWKKDTCEDEATAVVRFDDGVSLTLSLSSIDSNPRRGWVQVTGTKGTFIMDENQYEIIQQHRNGTRKITGDFTADEGWRFYRNIAAHLTNGTDLIITPEYARRPIHILDLANRSAKLGRTLKTKYG